MTMANDALREWAKTPEYNKLYGVEAPNSHGIEPIGGHLVVTIEKSETQRRMEASGLHMPTDSAERDRMAMMRGTILAVAADALFGLPEKVGKAALFGRYAGTTVKGADGEDYRLLRDEDVKGIINGCA